MNDEASGGLLCKDKEIRICRVDDVEVHLNDHYYQQVYTVDCEACLEDVARCKGQSNDDGSYQTGIVSSNEKYSRLRH